MRMKHGHVIKTVDPGSIGDELGLEPGDRLMSIDGHELEDIFDYEYYIGSESIEAVVFKKNGEEWELEIENNYEDLGLTFENGLMSEYRSCRNKCIFCFIDQMPKGMRETLYFKDDDSRLSFLQGNYITLTNMSDRDIDRIIRYHLCPINISVHTTNPELRCKMLSNRFAGEALKKIDRLAKASIEMNGQIVLCKDVNDKKELKRSIEDLSGYLPYMRSVSVVPAGLTKYREGLYPLKLFTKEDACSVIDMIESYQQDFYEKYGLHFIHASDEWYILAERDFPEEETYDGYIQLENGVGMMRLLYNEFMEALKEVKSSDKKREISLATGVLAYPMICTLVKEMQKKFKNIKVHVYKIINDFFGDTITVSGLLTGRDIINQLEGKELGELLLLPCNVLRAGEEVFLDNLTLKEVKTALQSDINIVKSGGKDLLDAFTSICTHEKETNREGFVYKQCYPDKDGGDNE